MKIYIAVIHITDKMKKSIPGFQSGSVYYKWKFHKDNGTWSVLYAWTRKKQHMKKFKSIHNNKFFSYYTEEFDNKIHFNEMIGTPFKDDRIRKRKLSSGLGKKVNVYITDAEYSSSTDECHIAESVIHDSLYQTTFPRPSIFEKHVLVALETLGYSKIFYDYGYIPSMEDDESDLISDMQIFYDNMSIAEHTDGTFYTTEGVISRLPVLKELESFIYNYEKILVGD